MSLDLRRVRAERVAKGYSQDDMAIKLDMSRSSYSKRENGTVPIGADELIKIADILEQPITIFLH